jgi:hypothetical protein
MNVSLYYIHQQGRSSVIIKGKKNQHGASWLSTTISVKNKTHRRMNEQTKLLDET